MMVIRSSQAVTDGLPGSANIPDQFGEQAAEIFAGLLAADHVPSIRAQLQSASPEPNGCRTTSLQGLQGEPKVPPHEQQEKEQFALLVNETRNAPDDEPDPGQCRGGKGLPLARRLDAGSA